MGQRGSDGWGDDDGTDLGGGLDLSRSGSNAGATGPSAYSGGGLSFGDDDDPFAEDVPGGSLELDVPTQHTAQSPRSMPAGQPPLAPPNNNPSGQPGGIPDLVMPVPRSSGNPIPNPPSQPNVSSPPRPPDPSAAFSGPPPSSPNVSAPPSSTPHIVDPQHLQQPPPSQPQLPPQPPRPPQPPDPAAMIARFPTPPDKIWEAPVYAIRVILRQLELRQDLASLKKKRSPDVPLYERALRTHDAKTFMVGLAITCAVLFLASFIFFLPVMLRFLRAPD